MLVARGTCWASPSLIATYGRLGERLSFSPLGRGNGPQHIAVNRFWNELHTGISHRREAAAGMLTTRAPSIGPTSVPVVLVDATHRGGDEVRMRVANQERTVRSVPFPERRLDHQHRITGAVFDVVQHRTTVMSEGGFLGPVIPGVGVSMVILVPIQRESVADAHRVSDRVHVV